MPVEQMATGQFSVKLSPLPVEGTAAESGLGRMAIDKQISGDLQASTQGQMLSAMTGTPGSAAYVAMEKVTGSLHGRSGSFVLQHTGRMDRGRASLSVRVVPDSGTEALTGLAGDFQIDIRDGQHFYTFAYSLPDLE